MGFEGSGGQRDWRNHLGPKDMKISKDDGKERKIAGDKAGYVGPKKIKPNAESPYHWDVTDAAL